MKTVRQFFCVVGISCALGACAQWDMRVENGQEVAYGDLLDKMYTAPSAELSNALVKAAIQVLRDYDPYLGYILVIKPCAVLARMKPQVVPDLFMQSFEPHYPYFAGMLIAIFLEAGMPNHAIRALHNLVQCSWPIMPTTDVVIAGIMMQLGQVAVFNEDRASVAAELFMKSPYKFYEKVYGYGGVLHLFVRFARGFGDADMPEFAASGMIAFARALIEQIKIVKPELLTVKDDSGQTAYACLCVAADKNRAQRPVVARVLSAISQLL